MRKCFIGLFMVLVVLPTTAQLNLDPEPPVLTGYTDISFDWDTVAENATFTLTDDAQIDWNDIDFSLPGNRFLRGGVATLLPGGQQFVDFSYPHTRIEDEQVTDSFICLVSIDDPAPECIDIPGEQDNFSVPQVSPDGRYIAFTQNFGGAPREPDIYLYDIEAEDVFNRTDDGQAGAFNEVRGALTDLLPVWHPDGSLYFFRYEGLREAPENRSLMLYRIPAAELTNDTAPEIVQDLTLLMDEERTIGIRGDDPRSTLRGYADVSPDGTQIALILNLIPEPEAPQGGIWLIDTTGEAPPQQIIDRGTILDSIAASTYLQTTDLNFLSISGLAWLPDGDALAMQASFRFDLLDTPFLMRWDVQTETLTNQLEYSPITEEADFYALDAGRQPLVSTMLPDGSLIYQDLLWSGLWRITQIGEEPQRLLDAATSEGYVLRAGSSPSVVQGDDAFYVLLADIVHTFE